MNRQHVLLDVQIVVRSEFLNQLTGSCKVWYNLPSTAGEISLINIEIRKMIPLLLELAMNGMNISQLRMNKEFYFEFFKWIH